MEARNSLPEIQGPSHFFKVILPSTLEAKMLKIPPKFVTKFGDELSSVATLTLPNGRVWQVGVVKERGKIWFGNGWSEFVENHSINTGHLLVFRFRSNSNFHVVIFDKSAFEIEYPISDGEEQESDLESDEEQSVEILGSTTLNSSFRTLGINFKNKSARAGPSRNAYSPTHKNEPRRTARQVGKQAVDKGNQLDHQEFYGFLKELWISISKACRNFTVEERQRALLAARLFKPSNHSFLVILRTRDLRNEYVYMPKTFWVKCLSKEVKQIKIQDSDRKEWPLSITHSRRGRLIRGGWRKFQQEKNLEEGDICVFELMRKRKRNDDFILKVSIHKINP
ncbi:B3 domain-containing transcription factor VRN1-like [Pistacia vera]|uniref:B3 domain-containing transcription factor VRN1-like n=1 Tax=Pistacia vera TaxID=55513 RepID=UPI0012634B1C|nr:B3 domain-containing transcription factor VRN1-like [Pistacia vera]